MFKRLNNDEETGYSPRIAILIGLVLSLGIGFLSVAVSMFPKPSGFSSFAFILPPLSITVGVILVTYVILWFLVVSPLGHVLKLDTIPLALSLAFFLGIIFTLSSVKYLTAPFTKDQIQLYKLFILFLIFFVSLLTSVAAYFAIKAVAHISNYRHTATVFSLATPFVLAETMVLEWLHTYKIGSFLSIPSFLVSVAYILIVLFTVWLFYRMSQKIKIMRLLTIFMALVLLSPFVTLLSIKASKASLGEKKDAGHKIKHVILIIDDTLRPDVLSCYNNQGLSAPHIDQLARDGLLFTKAISAAPWTLPSVASIMTGLSPSVHEAIKKNSKLPDNVRTLAEYMRDAGYGTAAFGHNPFLIPKYNVSQGFFEYNFFPKQWIGSYLSLRLFEFLFPNQFQLDASTCDLSKLTINWLESNYQKDFFFWIHYFDPHGPYTPPIDFLPQKDPSPSIGTKFSNLKGVRGGYFVPSLVERKWIKELYRAEVRYVDENIGKLFESLKRLNLYDESLIIFTSDHGEEFWEHDGYEHGHTLYNEVLWVPLIIKLPLSASKGKISVVVPTEGIMPTILDICGIGYKSDHLTVSSLSSLWGENNSTYIRQPIISTGLFYYEDRESVIFDELKYIRFLITKREELYDLRNDPGEQISIAASSPGGIRKARDILKEHEDIAKRLKEYYGITKSEEIKLDKETIEDLKSLGYVK